MNAKSCLLCGKSLARIRVGAGGDFCSREHRNQYRLRRSIDCLTEANKVATLARRRETPKPVFAGPAAGLANAAPRALDLGVGRQGSGASIVLPKVAAALPAGAKGIEGAHEFLTPGSQPRTNPRLDERASGVRREFGPLLSPPRAPKFPDCKAPEWNPRFSKRDPASPVALTPPPQAGNALRVSASATIRPRKLEIPSATGQLGKTGLRRVSRLHPLPPSPGAGSPAARLTYFELAFTAASDAPARLEWIGKTPGHAPGQEY